MSDAIRTTGLSKRYGDMLALDGLDLTVEPGEVYGYLGPNGAGKTTTIRLLLGLLRPNGGRAELFGVDEAGANALRFEVSGSVRPLLAALCAQPVVSLESRAPSLEEIFLHHYETGDGRGGG